ncbi:hypothetical protein ColKHC_06421 [Colletotrichum higginsianum]|nr:hypothetical protein ColKHC_06421 [Colletotrichum higginsianum]
MSLSLNFWILPLGVLGYSSTQNTCFGTRWPERCSLTHALTASFVRMLLTPSPSPSPSTVHPFFATTKAATLSPSFSSGTPTTAASLTPSIWNRQFSTSSGWMFSPPRMMRSLIRPVISTYPPSSIRASSPEYIHTRPSPSRRLTSAVLASSPQYPSMTRYPAAASSPLSPRGTTRALSSGSTILTAVCGMARPTLPVRFSNASSGAVMQLTGLVSVMP